LLGSAAGHMTISPKMPLKEINPCSLNSIKKIHFC
jgi:hypothetical protein